MKKCKVCGDKTEVVFNIDFKATPICEGCANVIFLQQAQWYVKEGVKKLNKPDVVERSEQLICPYCNKYKRLQGNGIMHQLCECGE